MRLIWGEETIRWFIDAGAYTGFHKALAKLILPHLEPGDTLCDAGCGVGRLDLELAPFVTSITAVDVSENAIDILRRDAETLGIGNLRTENCDAETLEGTFDVVLLSFFGQTDMKGFLKLCRRRLIRIADAGYSSGLYPARHREHVKETVPVVAARLEAAGVGFRLETAELEFGQPLRSMRDAEAYVLNNASKAGTGEVSMFLEANLERTGRDDFPFYLPSKKEVGIFIIDVQG